MVNVHASGGRKMMETAAKRLSDHRLATHLIAVTVLTSMGKEDLAEVGLTASPAEHVMHLAALTQQSGLNGVVCSAQEAAQIRAKCGEAFFESHPRHTAKLCFSERSTAHHDTR